MPASISTLKAMLVLDTSKWNAGFASAQKTAGGFAGGILSKVTPAVAALGASVVSAGAAVLTAGVGFSGLFNSLSRVGNLSSISKRLGITVEQTQILGLAAEQTGVDVEELSKGMLMMGRNIGSGGKSLDKRLLDVADAFEKIKDPGERAAFARSVFGKSGFEFINLLAKGSEGIRRSADAIDRFGLAISDIDAKKAKDAMLALHELKTVLGGIKDKIAIELAPTVTSFMSTWMDGLEVLIRNWGRLTEAINGSSKAVQSGSRWYDYVFAALGAGPGVGFGDAVKGLADARESAMRDAQNAARSRAMPGQGIAGKGLSAAGALGSLMPKFPAALEKGSVEAARAITQAGGNPFVDALKPVVDKLTLIERHEAAMKRGQTKMPLRPSNLRGGGSR